VSGQPTQPKRQKITADGCDANVLAPTSKYPDAEASCVNLGQYGFFFADSSVPSRLSVWTSPQYSLNGRGFSSKTQSCKEPILNCPWCWGCRIPRNLRFQLCDFESEWTLGKESFDLIHIRQGCGSVSSWPMLYKRIFEYVKFKTLVYQTGIEVPNGALQDVGG
jgi:hypothetical protein